MITGKMVKQTLVQTIYQVAVMCFFLFNGHNFLPEEHSIDPEHFSGQSRFVRSGISTYGSNPYPYIND